MNSENGNARGTTGENRHSRVTPAATAARHKTAQFSVRVPPSVKAELEKLASENGRSLGSEITFRLEQSLAMDPVQRAVDDINDIRRTVRDLYLSGLEALKGNTQ